MVTEGGVRDSVLIGPRLGVIDRHVLMKKKNPLLAHLKDVESIAPSV